MPAPALPVGGVGARLADLVADGVEAAVLVMSTSGPDVACAQEGRGQRVLVRAGSVIQGGGERAEAELQFMLMEAHGTE